MRVGNKVIYIGDTFAGEKGTIENVTDCYIIVRFENGSLRKCLPQEIEIIEESVPETITITREDFEKAVAKVIKPNLYVDDINDYGLITAVCLSGNLVCKKLAQELFGDND